jgi:hypothetical protein
MTKGPAMLVGALLVATLSPSTARASLDPSRAEADARAALEEGDYSFCSAPARPLSRSSHALCPLAKDIAGCEGLVVACADELAPARPKGPPSTHPWIAALAWLARAAVWVLVFGAIIAIAIPIVRAVLRARSDRKGAEEPTEATVTAQGRVASAPSPDESDAETLLRRAAAHAAAGRLDAALFAYLNAALRALDERGAIRIARHRTNGEYVRACTEAGARPELLTIVREVDTVQFGGRLPTNDGVARAAASAASVVGAARPRPSPGVAPFVAMALFVLAVGACGGPLRKGSNPAGDDLLFDLLRRQGASASYLAGSLATLPLEGRTGAAVIVDVEKTQLEDDTKAHLLRWVDQGGVLVLAGDVEGWPREFWANRDNTDNTDNTESVEVVVEQGAVDEADDDPPLHTARAKLARPAAITWPHEGPVAISAHLESGELYGGTRGFGLGTVLGLANHDLLTNVGLATGSNASALVTMLAALGKSAFLVARPENGVAPPNNPIAGMHRIGLGLAMVHALVFAGILFLAAGVRHARPTPAEPPRRRAFAEHIEATGALYARAGVAPHALAAYARYADERLRSRMPRGADPAAFLALRAGADPDETARLYQRAMSSSEGSRARGDEFEVLRRLSALFSAAMRAD